MQVELDDLAPPDLPMPRARAEARHHALLRELDRTRRPRAARVLRVAAVPAVTLGLATLVVLGTDPGGTQVTLTSSWTAQPARLDPQEARSAAAACRGELGRHPWPTAVAPELAPVASERRGRLAAVLMVSRQQYGLCVLAGDRPLFSGVGRTGDVAPRTGVVVDGEPGRTSGPDQVRVIYGQVAPDVSAVVLDLTDGRRVVATVTGGRFLAWWPSGASASTITAATAGGRVVAVVHRPGAEGSVAPARSPGR